MLESAILKERVTVLPECVARLFWEVDAREVNPDANSDYVLERVMARGGWDAMQWLRDRYPVPVLADFLERKAARLPPRERAYWALVAGVEIEVPRGGGRPAWAGE